MDKLTRIKGVLVGGAYGDAMGMPTEGWSYNAIHENFPEGIKTFYPSQKNFVSEREFAAGEVTDDTINTLMIIRSISECFGSLDAENYVKKLINWHRNSDLSLLVSGPTTLRAISQIESGVALSETGKFGTTNGAAMKISPVGIVADYRDLADLVRKVEQICLPTHHTSIAIAGASAIAVCISYVINGGQRIAKLWELAQEAIHSSMEYGTDFPSPSLAKRLEQAKTIVQEADKEEALFRLYNEIGSGIQTIETVPAVLGIIDLAQGNPVVAGQLAAEIGGDTDTIGAIACGICGGLYPDLLSKEVEEKLAKVNKIDFDQYVKMLVPYLKDDSYHSL